MNDIQLECVEMFMKEKYSSNFWKAFFGKLVENTVENYPTDATFAEIEEPSWNDITIPPERKNTTISSNDDTFFFCPDHEDLLSMISVIELDDIENGEKFHTEQNAPHITNFNTTIPEDINLKGINVGISLLDVEDQRTILESNISLKDQEGQVQYGKKEVTPVTRVSVKKPLHPSYLISHNDTKDRERLFLPHEFVKKIDALPNESASKIYDIISHFHYKICCTIDLCSVLAMISSKIDNNYFEFHNLNEVSLYIDSNWQLIKKYLMF